MNSKLRKNSHSQKINEVLIYIQNNLGGQLSLQSLAKLACLSSFHFHRIFTACVGESLHFHIHRLRMEHAAFKLRHGKDSITDIALSIGYETSAAFSKGFKQNFGLPPSQYRNQQFDNAISQFRTPGEISLLDSVNSSIHAEIRDLSEQTLLFIRKTGYFQQVAQEAWNALMPYAYKYSLVAEQTKFIGIVRDDPELTPIEKIHYDACISICKPHKIAGEMGLQRLAGGKYACFLHEGPYHMAHEIYHKIYGVWLPNSGHYLRDRPSFSLYLTPHYNQDSDQCRTEIYIPIS